MAERSSLGQAGEGVGGWDWEEKVPVRTAVLKEGAWKRAVELETKIKRRLKKYKYWPEPVWPSGPKPAHVIWRSDHREEEPGLTWTEKDAVRDIVELFA